MKFAGWNIYPVDHSGGDKNIAQENAKKKQGTLERLRKGSRKKVDTQDPHI